MNRSLMLGIIVLASSLTATALAQSDPKPVAASLCDVFAAPTSYSHRVLSLEGVLFPSIHSVFLLSPSCELEEKADTTTEVILPPGWLSLPKGKELRAFLHNGKSASVKLTGRFEGDADRYGPDGARFRFTVIEISSVEKSPPNIHP